VKAGRAVEVEKAAFDHTVIDEIRFVQLIPVAAVLTVRAA
jgi:hypothetical protein